MKSEEDNTTRYEHDPNGNVTSAISPVGARTEIKYDALDRQREITEPDGAVTKLETQAAAQERIAATAMMMETYIDSMGEKRSRSVPDTARRSAARQSASQMRQAAAAKKQQAAALKAAAAALAAQISALHNAITTTKRYIENIISIVQRTDLTYAQQMDAIGAETQAFIAKINGIYNSFSDTSLSTNNGSITGLLSSSNPHDNPLMGAGGPNNPHDQPGISEWRFWEDLTNKEITYLAACTALNVLYGNISDKERKDIADELAKSYANNPKIVAAMNAFGDGAYQMPVFPVASGTLGEGWPNYSEKYGGDYHGGVDIKADRGTPIVSATAGTVVNDVVTNVPDNYNLQKNNPYGNYVVIELDNGDRIYYAHMQEGSPSVKKGDKVNPGDPIGNVGSSGRSSVDHVHVEVYTSQNKYNDNYLQSNPNPADYITGLTTK